MRPCLAGVCVVVQSYQASLDTLNEHSQSSCFVTVSQYNAETGYPGGGGEYEVQVR